MLQIVLAVVLTAHLLLVDLAMGGPIASIWLDWRARRRGDGESEDLARRLAGLSVGALAVGSILGGVLLAVRYLAGDAAYFEALGAIPPSRIWFGLAELLFSFACLGAYVALWNRWRGHRVFHRLLALAGTSNLAIHFPALFAVVAVLSTRGEITTLDRADYQRMLLDGEVLSRVLHVWLASAAVTGIGTAALALRTAESRLPDAQRRRHLAWGARLALGATAAQFPVGVWMALEMPEAVRQPLLGADPVATGLFLGSLLLSLWLLHLLSATALGDPEAKHVRRSAAVVALVVLLMVGTRLRLNTQSALLPGRGADAPGVAAGLASARTSDSIGEARGRALAGKPRRELTPWPWTSSPFATRKPVRAPGFCPGWD